MTAHDVEFLGLTFIFAAVLLCSSKTPSEGVVSPAPTQCSQRVTAQLGFPSIPWHCRGTDAPAESDSSQRCTATGWERSQAAAGKSQQDIRKKLFTGSLEQVAHRSFEIPVPNLDVTQPWASFERGRTRRPLEVPCHWTVLWESSLLSPLSSPRGAHPGWNRTVYGSPRHKMAPHTACNILALNSQSACGRQSLVCWISSTIQEWRRPRCPLTGLHKVRDLKLRLGTQGNCLASFLPNNSSRWHCIPCPLDSPFSSQQNQRGLTASVCGQIATTLGGELPHVHGN